MNRAFSLIFGLSMVQASFLPMSAIAHEIAPDDASDCPPEVAKLTPDQLAGLKINDPLLLKTYEARVGKEVIEGKPGSFVAMVDADIARRGAAVGGIFVSFFHQGPDLTREVMLNWLSRKDSWSAEAVLKEARQVYASEKKTMSASMCGRLASALARRGVASDMEILLEMQRRWGGSSFENDIIVLQSRIDAAAGKEVLPPVGETDYLERIRARALQGK
jgi:hypothetical protein